MKKRISFIAAMVMLITTIFSNSVFATSFTDVDSNNRYRTAIITLSKFAVINGYDDGSFKPEGKITRAEFTKMLVSALGLGDNTTEPTEFSDVADHWAKCYIKTAYDLGIINGFEDGTFKPEDSITYEQALKMMVCTLNYGPSALTKGGYPEGYIAQANELKITSNVVGQVSNAPAARQVVAQVIYNALEVKKLEKDSIGVWTKSDKTMLSDDLKVEKVKGRLIGVEDTKTNECTENLIRNQIAVKPTSTSNTDVLVINLGDFDDYTIGELAKMIGNEVTIYYRQGDSILDRELKILDAETTENTSTTIKHTDFAGYNGRTFKYIDGPSTKSLKIAENATIIYNGQAVDKYPVEVKDRVGDSNQSAANADQLLGYWLGADKNYRIKGEAVFTDAGSDGSQDIITIYDYKTILAYKAPTTADYRLQNKLKTGDFINLDPDDINKKIYIEKDGRTIQATAIKADDVVSYTESLDESILNVYVANQTAKGSVNSINTTDMKITIANTEYDLGESCISYIQEKEGKTLTSGVSGTFYLDKLGAVIYGKLDTVTANPYAYISNISESSNDDTAYISLYYPTASTKTTSTYTLAEKVSVNGTQYKSYADVVSRLKTIAADTNPDASASGVYASGTAKNISYSQPVRVKISNNKITEINVLDSTTLAQNEDTTKLGRYKELKKYYYTGSSFKTSYSSSVEFTVNSTSTILYVPQDRTDKSKYAKKTISNAFKSDRNYWVEAYDVNKSNVASLVILYGDAGNVNELTKSSDYSIVAKPIEDVYDAEDDTTSSLMTVYTSSTTATKGWTALNKSVVADIAVGDVIQFEYDDSNKVTKKYDVIKYKDILSILNGKTVDATYDEVNRKEVYNWDATVEQTAENRWQKYMFDFRYPKSNTSATDNYYVTETHSTLGTVPYSRVCVYNVYQLIEDANENISKIYATKEGFEDGTLRENVAFDEVPITASTKFLRMENTNTSMSYSPYAAGTTTPLTARDDLKDAEHYGADCSKVIVVSNLKSSSNGYTQMIIILPENN